MYTTTVKYEDFNGVTREEDFSFNLSKTELLEMSSENDGTYGERIQKMVKANDNIPMINVFKELLLKAYGEKSDDGRYFNKEDENGRPLYKKFERSAAYPELFMKFATDDEAAAEFINNIVPKEMALELAKANAHGISTND